MNAKLELQDVKIWEEITRLKQENLTENQAHKAANKDLKKKITQLIKENTKLMNELSQSGQESESGSNAFISQ